jgi:hypothetical protein
MAKQNPGNGNSRNAADKRGLDHSSAGDVHAHVHARDTVRHCRSCGMNSVESRLFSCRKKFKAEMSFQKS